MSYRANGTRANGHRANGNRANVVAPYCRLIKEQINKKAQNKLNKSKHTLTENIKRTFLDS